MIFYSPRTGGFYDQEIHGDAIPDDVVGITSQRHAELLDGQSLGRRIVPNEQGDPILADQPPLTIEQRAAIIERAVQGYIDATAEAAGYDDMRSAVGYADEPAVPKYQAEGRALRAWRSLVWARCYELMTEVATGNRVEPNAQQVIALLPPPPVL